MISSGTSLLLLVVALLLALAGLRDVLAAAGHRDVLSERAGAERPVGSTIRAVAALEAALGRTKRGRGLETALSAGAVPLTPLQFLAASFGGGLGAFALMSFVFSTLMAAVGGLMVMRGAWVYLKRKRAQRRDRFVGQLPDLARVLANGTSAGLSVTAALEIAVTELDEPAAHELRIALEEVRIGQAFEQAFSHLGDRMPSRELGVLVNTLVIQQRAGGDLVRALSDMEATLDQRKDTLREIKTIMSGAVATAYMVALIGASSIFALDLFQPGTIDALTGSVIGVAVIAVAASLYAFGFFLVGRTTRIDA